MRKEMNPTRAGVVYGNEISSLIEDLKAWLGAPAVRKGVERLSKSFRSTGPAYRDYYLRVRHPFWDGFRVFQELRSSRAPMLSQKDNLLLMALAEDARKILTLASGMPTEVQKKYQRDLCDDDRAKDYLFELDIAWQFYLAGYELEWHADSGSTRAEFIAKNDQITIDVECKKVSPDAGRSIRRDLFYRLVDKIQPHLAGRGLSGRVHLTVPKSLPTDEKELKSLSETILEAIRADNSELTNWGRLEVSLTNALMYLPEYTLPKIMRSIRNQLPYAHAALIGKRFPLGITHKPLEFIVSSEREDTFLSAIEDRLTAASKQLDPKVPGIVAIFIPEIADFNGLEEDSKLRDRTNVFLDDALHSHVAAVAYSSDFRIARAALGYESSAPTLVWYNGLCQYQVPLNFLATDHKVQQPDK